MPPVGAARPPNVIGKYILGERMSSGGMAELFHATPVSGRFDGPIVLKRMLPELAAEQDFVSMFIEEARISTRLDHPNIVKVHDFDASDHGLFLVMELVDGPDLLAVMSRGAQLGRKVEPELAAYIACHVLEALDYAHKAATPKGERLHVVHRDVSPSNILITRRGYVKLADFGIAKASEMGRTSEIASGTLKGKFGYMSPEQIRGEQLDGRSDVFSMGIVLAEMLMSKRLFSAPDDVELLLMVRRGDLRRLDMHGKDIPAELDAIVRKALAVDLDDRYATADAFREALVEWLANSTRRTGSARLAELLRDLEREGGALCTWSTSVPKSGQTMSGTQTVVARQAASHAAALGRIAFASVPANQARVASSKKAIAAAPAAQARQAGSAIAPGTVIDLLCTIARERRTCAVLFQQEELFKEAYFANGHPVFVRCNLPDDRFGEFLVRKRILSREQLDRVLAVLDRFDGRMGQALVSLGLLTPVDAVRLLAEQVAGKLLGACAWGSGQYAVRDGEQNPWPALDLGMRTQPILGRSLVHIPIDRLVSWMARVGDRPAVLDVDRVRAFEIEPSVTHHLQQLTTNRGNLREVIDALASPPERLIVTASAYVLWRCGVLRTSAPAGA
jgi:serine/threonine protein kinase